MIKVKICCISSKKEATLAIKYGASALGLVSKMPSGPGVISDELITDIVKTIPSNIDSFLLTSKTDTQKIITQHSTIKSSSIQIVDSLRSGTYDDFKNKIPSIKIVQVIHVLDENTIDEALKIAQLVDVILLDSGNPNLKIKELGGTGRKHNWEISRKIVEQSPIPVFLAGGINSENLREAIEIVKPYGLDLCSSVRTEGLLDEVKLNRFFDEIRRL